MLGWSVETLAHRAHVGTATVLRVEHTNHAAGRYQTIDKIERALYEGGVRLIEGSHGNGGIEFTSHAESACNDEDRGASPENH